MGVISTKGSFIKSNWPHITPFAPRSQPAQMSFEQFQYAFVNTLPPAGQRAAYDRYAVPESRRVPLESLTGAARLRAFGRARNAIRDRLFGGGVPQEVATRSSDAFLLGLLGAVLAIGSAIVLAISLAGWIG